MRLHCLRDPQHVAQPLVLNDGTLVHFSQPVVLTSRYCPAICPEFDTPVRILPDLDIPADQLAVLRRVLQQIHDPVVPHGQRLAHLARLAPREHQIKLLVSPQRPVRIESALRWLREARIVKAAMKTGAHAFASATVLTPRSRNSLTSRSCSVRCARSTRPLAGLLFAQNGSMFSSYIARPKCVTLLPSLFAPVLRNTLYLSL
ncbi:hypothetical protein B0G77_5731 [Paraburkholderia sp. BL10I2N1]|nr:hypothetical protein B0G77_5731 [Paraburkholderia sp. BL10I2N1]